MRQRLIVTIDGPSGAGKSTVSKILASRLGLTYIDTGAMYRCVAWAARKRGIDPEDAKKLEELCRRLAIEFQWTPEGNRVFCDGIEVTKQIRSPEMDMLASAVSRVPAVRRALVRRQRQMGESGRVILEGRDAGTVIFPDAELKIYLDARAEERGRRRHREQRQRGTEISLDEVIADIRKRDHNDSTRAHSPLQAAPDARVLDTSGMNIEQVVAAITAMIREIDNDEN